MHEALYDEFRAASASLEAEKVALGWTRENGWPVPDGPRDRRALNRARKHVAGLYSEIKDLEAAMEEDGK